MEGYTACSPTIIPAIGAYRGTAMILALGSPAHSPREWLRRACVVVGVWISHAKCFAKMMIGMTFGLLIYTIRLARGTIAPKLRRELSIALAICWIVVLAVAALCGTSSPVGVAAAYKTAFVLVFTFIAMALASVPIYNRVNFGHYG